MMKKKEIFVSVLMSAYSESEQLLREAIDSILSQTFTNFEFIIILDKPDNDSLWSVLEECRSNDKRVVLLRNDVNCGLAASLNRGLTIAKGDYVVRMDADDISLPERMTVLVEYMESHPEIGVCSSWMKAFGSKKHRENSVVKYPTQQFDLELMSLYQTPIAHAPCVIRRSVIDKYSPLYNEKCCRTQDYELWSRLMREGVTFSNIAKPLYLRRASNSVGPEPIPYQVIHNQISRNNIQRVLNRFDIKLPNNITIADMRVLSDAYRICADKADKKRLAVILFLYYMTVEHRSIGRMLQIIADNNISLFFKLSPKSVLRFQFTNTFGAFNINNLCTDHSNSIFQVI